LNQLREAGNPNIQSSRILYIPSKALKRSQAKIDRKKKDLSLQKSKTQKASNFYISIKPKRKVNKDIICDQTKIKWLLFRPSGLKRLF